MASDKPIRVAIVGLGFGAEFIPIYQDYPGAEMSRDLPPSTRRTSTSAATAGRSPSALHRLRRAARTTPTSTPSTSTRRSPTTPRRVVAALKAGKHVACTVPMAHDRSTNAGRSSRPSGPAGKVYMMMETVVYSREYLFVKELYDKGELGRIQFLRGSHQQDMDGWPDYWPGLPPMHYATHCVSPCLAIAGQARRERRLPRLGPDPRGADPEVRQPVRHRDGDVQDQGFRRRAPRSPAACSTPPGSTARASTPTAARRASSGSRSRARSRSSTPTACPSPRSPSGCKVPDYAHLLPEPIQRFTTKGVYDAEDETAPLVHPGRRPRRLAPAPGPRLAQRHPGRAPRPARRRDLGQLDDGRHLCPRVGDEGRREDRDSDVLKGDRSGSPVIGGDHEYQHRERR